MEEFLEKFPHPELSFDNPRVSRLYKRHVEVYLLNRFPAMAEEFVLDAIFMAGPRLMPVLRYLAAIDSEDRACVARNLREHKPMPRKRDQGFYDELYFVLNREEISALAAALRL